MVELVLKDLSLTSCSRARLDSLLTPQYPEASTDKGLRLGNICPDFKAETTQGPMEFHKWKEGKWAILFSHPADFTPVCTTEIGRLALKYDTLAAMDW